MELINTFFNNVTAKNIFNTPLFPSVTHDVHVWKFEMDGAYSVKSAYKDILNHDVAVVQHRVRGNWNCIWSLKLPRRSRISHGELVVIVCPQESDCNQKEFNVLKGV